MNATEVDRTFMVLSLRRRSLIDAATLLVDGWQFYRAMRGSGGDAGASADAVEVERSITVGRPANELHEFWHDPEQLSHVMGRFIEVSGEGEDHQRWEVGRPGGRTIAWDNEIVEDSPGEILQWKSVKGATIPNEGTVRFRSAPGDWETEVMYRSRFDPPGGTVGREVANRLNVVSGALVNKALHRFKSLAETGEIPTLRTNPSARGRGDLL
jgi:uncharacterized membrane protein